MCHRNLKWMWVDRKIEQITFQFINHFSYFCTGGLKMFYLNASFTEYLSNYIHSLRVFNQVFWVSIISIKGQKKICFWTLVCLGVKNTGCFYTMAIPWISFITIKNEITVCPVMTNILKHICEFILLYTQSKHSN